MLKHLIIVCIYASLLVPQYCPAGQHDGDPWEVWNRKVFQFNDVVDTYTLKPVTKTYRFIFPKPVRGLFQNFLENIGEFRNITSAAAMQLYYLAKYALHDAKVLAYSRQGSQ